MAKFKNSNRGRHNSRTNLAQLARTYKGTQGFTEYGAGAEPAPSPETTEKKPPRTLKDFIAERKQRQ